MNNQSLIAEETPSLIQNKANHNTSQEQGLNITNSNSVNLLNTSKFG